MKKVEKAAGGLKKRIRDRMRSVNKKVIAIALAGRLKGPEGEERRVERYRELVSLTRKIVHQAEGVLEEMQHRNDGRTCAAGGAANQGARVSGDHQVSAQDRESFRTAHGNHSQGESEKAQRVRQAGTGAGS